MTFGEVVDTTLKYIYGNQFGNYNDLKATYKSLLAHNGIELEDNVPISDEIALQIAVTIGIIEGFLFPQQRVIIDDTGGENVPREE